jgi:hypothetical protein
MRHVIMAHVMAIGASAPKSTQNPGGFLFSNAIALLSSDHGLSIRKRHLSAAINRIRSISQMIGFSQQSNAIK